MTTSNSEAVARLERLEELYRRADTAMDEAATALAAIETAHDLVGPVMAAYDTQWLADVEATEALNLRLAVVGEDTIWDLHSRHHELMKRLLRLSAHHFAPTDD